MEPISWPDGLPAAHTGRIVRIGRKRTAAGPPFQDRKGRGNPMASFRIDRTNEDILRELTAILRTVKDPRVTAVMLSIVRVEVTNDMSYAKVFVSAMEGLDAAKTAVKGLVSAQGYIRHELGAALGLRHVPELRFIPDDSIAYSAGIAKKLNDLERAQRSNADAKSAGRDGGEAAEEEQADE